MKIQLKLIEKDDKAFLSDLMRKWQTLYKQATPNVFLSWAWIGSWLNSVSDGCYLLEVIEEGRPVGLAVLVERERRYFKWFKSKQIYLHRTGDVKRDQVWIEFNDFLFNEDFNKKHPDCRTTIIKALRNKLHFDEFILGMSTKPIVESFAQAFPRMEFISKEPGYWVDLTIGEEQYLNSLSRNTRSQLKRNDKKIESFGKIELHFAKDGIEGVEYFYQAGQLHKEKWGKSSGYYNPHFCQFHELYIKSALESGKAELVKVSAGEQPIGYFYNLIENNTVYFYLAGLNLSLDPKIKPGLLAHQKLIEHYRKKCFSSYDFMAGQARYKNSFSTGKYEMSYVAFRSNKILFKVLKILKASKNQLTNALSKKGSSDV